MGSWELGGTGSSGSALMGRAVCLLLAPSRLLGPSDGDFSAGAGVGKCNYYDSGQRRA